MFHRAMALVLLIGCATEKGPDTGTRDSAPAQQACETPSADAAAVEVDPSCEADPVIEVQDPWEIVVEWGWGDPDASDGSYVMPTIGNLDDDDGDGDVDDDDIPDVALSSWTEGLVVFSGADGSRIFALSSGGFDKGSAIGDLDGDGRPEVVTATEDGDLVAVEGDGTLLWQRDALGLIGYIQPALADLDADGDVEIITEAGVFAGEDGSTVFELPPSTSPYTTTVVADLDEDGCQEIIVGELVLDCEGALLWLAPESTMGHFAAVVQGDDDPAAELLFFYADSAGSGGGAAALYEADGTEILAFDTPGRSAAPPCAADFDGDGAMEFGLPDGETIGVYERDGTARWTEPVTDLSGLAGCSGFDIDADGAFELLYGDELTVYAFDGASGAVRWQTEDHASATVFEYPTVADVDRDGSAEIVVASGRNSGGTYSGVVVYGHAAGGWPEAGPSWPAHDYRVSNFAADGRVPTQPEASWRDPGVFRARPATPGEARPDLAVELLGLCADDCLSEPVRIGYQVSNLGAADVSAGAQLALYAVGETEDYLVDLVELPAVPAGAALASGIFEVEASYFGAGGFRLAVDDDGAGHGEVRECDEDNNTAAQAGPVCEL